MYETRILYDEWWFSTYLQLLASINSSNSFGFLLGSSHSNPKWFSAILTNSKTIILLSYILLLIPAYFGYHTEIIKRSITRKSFYESTVHQLYWSWEAVHVQKTNHCLNNMEKNKGSSVTGNARRMRAWYWTSGDALIGNTTKGSWCCVRPSNRGDSESRSFGLPCIILLM